MQKIGHMTLLVKDLDEALDFYTNKLNFNMQADNKMGNGYRWLSVTPKDQPDFGIVFVLANTREEKQSVGNQSANRVMLTLQTDDCKRDYEILKSKGVKFSGEPKQMPYGTDVVFEDLYGNRFDLVELAAHG